MATLFSLFPSSSAILSPSRIPKGYFSLKTKKRTLCVRRPLSADSLPSAEADTSRPPPPAVQKFWQWISEEGVFSSKTPVEPGVVPQGLGLVARRDIARNEVVLEVPKRFWINPDTVSASEIGSVCGGLRPWVSVALFLIREKLRDDSPWRYYIDILPEFTNSTIYWWVSFTLLLWLYYNPFHFCLLAGGFRSDCGAFCWKNGL